MKAIVVREFGGPDVLRLEDVPDPTPGPGQVVVRAAACGVNRGDMGRRQGTYGRGGGETLPFIVGWEMAGTIEAVGDGVAGFRAGDRVVALMPAGGYAEKAAVPAAALARIPETLTFEEAAGIPVAYLTAWFALTRRAGLRAGETVLVQAGGSGVGVAAIQMAKHLGARVITTAGSEEKLARARTLGADEVINYRTASVRDAVAQVTGGRGVDVVVESVGGRTSVESVEALAVAGRLVSVGNSSREPAPVDLAAVFGKNASLLGFYLGIEMLAPDAGREFQHVVDLCASGAVKVIVDSVLPLSEAPVAHQRLIDRANFGKLILKP